MAEGLISTLRAEQCIGHPRQHGAHLIALPTIEAMTVYPGIAHTPDIAFEGFYTS